MKLKQSSFHRGRLKTSSVIPGEPQSGNRGPKQSIINSTLFLNPHIEVTCLGFILSLFNTLQHPQAPHRLHGTQITRPLCSVMLWLRNNFKSVRTHNDVKKWICPCIQQEHSDLRTHWGGGLCSVSVPGLVIHTVRHRVALCQSPAL